MREKITEVRDKLANKDEMDPEEIKSTVSDLQQSSLKLFEIAYKKVSALYRVVQLVGWQVGLTRFRGSPGILDATVAASSPSRRMKTSQISVNPTKLRADVPPCSLAFDFTTLAIASKQVKIVLLGLTVRLLPDAPTVILGVC